MSEDEYKIAKLRVQVSLMRKVVKALNTALIEITKRPTPPLPSIVFEEI